jgi:hypothetical protein
MDQRSGPFTVWHDEAADIVQVDWAAGSTVDLPAAEASTRAVRALERTGVRMLVDTRGIKVFERAARGHFLAEQGGSIAMALLVGSAVNKMIANFFIGMHKQSIPVRMFTDRDSAITWLHEQR